MRRSTKTILAGAAGAGMYLAGSALSGRTIRLASLVAITGLGTASLVTHTQALNKAQAAHNRIDDIIKNGFATAGDLHCAGNTHADGNFYIGGSQLTLNHGSPSKQGGAPGSYSAAYESALAAEIAAVIDKLASANIF